MFFGINTFSHGIQMSLCEYKNLFGKPGEGIHSYRVLGVGFFDVLITVLVAYFISWLLKTPFLYTTIAFFILGIVVHRALCVRTTVDKLLFPDAE
jgi:hypothetical protein